MTALISVSPDTEIIRHKNGDLRGKCLRCDWVSAPYTFPRQVDNSLSKHRKAKHKDG